MEYDVFPRTVSIRPDYGFENDRVAEVVLERENSVIFIKRAIMSKFFLDEKETCSFIDVLRTEMRPESSVMMQVKHQISLLV